MRRLGPRLVLLALVVWGLAAIASAQVGRQRTALIRIATPVPAPEIRCGPTAVYADVRATVARGSGRLRRGMPFTAHVSNCDAIAAGCYEVSVTSADLRAMLVGRRIPTAGEAVELRAHPCP